MALPQKIFVTASGTDANSPRVDSVAVTGANTYYSKMWTGGDSVSYSLHVIWTGTPTGTFTLQVTDKPSPTETTDADWVTSTEVAVVNPAGVASQFLVSTVSSPHMKRRLKYVNSAGSGVLTGWVTVPHGVT
jgi:hypothetical protein